MESSVIIVVFLVAMIGLMLFQNKKQKASRQALQDFRLALSKGDKIMTSSGLLGEIESIDESSNTAVVISGSTSSVWLLDAISKRTADTEGISTSIVAKDTKKAAATVASSAKKSSK